ncbi:hypothetical protein shim_23700 [Shimia sp. SK013]|uniref:sulfotransferase family protein n=1 Tax=Shimia sp. SK013 TaxID=1389006 RepID=UPI0006B56243|nr:sulfotransferase family protein [Shimia sp. SK013]KPA21663.1 hypothetical protein shim_23700 [Shimia sp. SK013]
MNGLFRPIDTTNGLKLLGERNSGTNLLTGLLTQVPNLKLFPSTPLLRQRDMPLYRRPWTAPLVYKAAHEATLDDWHLRDLPQTGGWKHAAPDAAFLKQFLEEFTPAVLIILRHPAVWLRSMHRNPFHALNPVPRDFSKFIRQEWLCVGRDSLERRILPNLPHLQAAKANAYSNLLSQYPNSSLIRYEDLASDPTGTLAKIGVALPPRTELPGNDARGFARRQSSGTDYAAAARQARFDLLSPADAAFTREAQADSPLSAIYQT